MLANFLKFNRIGVGLLTVMFMIYARQSYGGVYLPFITIEKGTYSGITEPSYAVIKGEDDWNNFWDRHVSNIIPKPDVPEIDFSKEMVIGVFAGQKNSGGYEVEIVKILKEENSIKVLYKERVPLPDEVVTAVITQPYHFIKMPKEDLKVIFQNIN